jgi:hypothetical protein
VRSAARSAGVVGVITETVGGRAGVTIQIVRTVVVTNADTFVLRSVVTFKSRTAVGPGGVNNAAGTLGDHRGTGAFAGSVARGRSPTRCGPPTTRFRRRSSRRSSGRRTSGSRIEFDRPARPAQTRAVFIALLG